MRQHDLAPASLLNPFSHPALHLLLTCLPCPLVPHPCPTHGAFLLLLQKWYLLEYRGDESEIDLSCHGHPEFSQYSWAALESLPDGVVDFKQGVYRQVARHFAPEIARRVGQAVA